MQNLHSLKSKRKYVQGSKSRPSVAIWRPKKKNGRSMGNVPKCAHKIKMKKMGVPKQKDGEMPIFSKSIFGAHLLPIPAP